MERVRLTRDLRSEGYDPAELARLRRTGTIRSVRRGAYATGASSMPGIPEIVNGPKSNA